MDSAPRAAGSAEAPSRARRRLGVEAALLFSLLALLAWTRVVAPGWARLHRIRAREAALRAEVRDLEGRVARMERRTNALLAGEPATVERAIREQLGWGRPGEYLVVLPPDTEPE